MNKDEVLNVLDNAISCATDEETIECLEIAKYCVRKHYTNCEIKNCLSCCHSHSEPGEDGDILHCMEKDGEIVGETDWCACWN